MAVCYRSLVVSDREITSSHSIELAEIGMDEALWAMNNGFDANWIFAGGNATKTLTDPDHPPYPAVSSQPFTYDKGATGKVIISVTGYAGPNPQITVTGEMKLAGGTIITRRLRSDVIRAPLFTNAIGATSGITFSDSGLVDSYDSSQGYTAPDPAHLTALNSAAVVSAPDVNAGKAQIYGFAATLSPTLGDPTPFLYQTGAKILGPNSASGATIDPARRSLNPIQPVFNPVTLSGAFDVASLGSESEPLKNAVTPMSAAGIYRLDTINLSTGAELLITAPVVLIVTNSVRTSDTGRITIGPGGSLQLQIEETNGQGLVLQGAGIVNQSNLPQNLSVFVGGHYTGHPTSTIDADNDFYGTIYLPNDDITVWNTNIYGALVAKSVTFAGAEPSIHYDVALQRNNPPGITTPFTLKELKELKPGES